MVMMDCMLSLPLESNPVRPSLHRRPMRQRLRLLCTSMHTATRITLPLTMS